MVTLKPNMYVRTNKGKIGKIIKQIDNSGSLHHDNYVWLLDNGNMLALHSNKVKNASFNLIDLIEVGDYVNGYLVTYIDKNDQILRVDGFGWGTNIIRKYNIKSIVTKEQFNLIKYEVK